MPSREEFEVLSRVLRAAHLNNKLPAVLGTALGKNAVLIALIDAEGAVLTCGDNKADTPHTKRDRSMIHQMTELLADNMQAMMTKAGKVEE